MGENQGNSNAIKIFEGISEDNIGIIRKWVKETGYIFSARPTNRIAAIKLSKDADPKGMGVKGKSSQQNGFIPVDPRLSKVGNQWYNSKSTEKEIQKKFDEICDFNEKNKNTINEYNKYQEKLKEFKKISEKIENQELKGEYKKSVVKYINSLKLQKAKQLTEKINDTEYKLVYLEKTPIVRIDENGNEILVITKDDIGIYFDEKTKGPLIILEGGDNKYYKAIFDKDGNITKDNNEFNKEEDEELKTYTYKPYEVFATCSINENLEESKDLKFLTADVDCLTGGSTSSAESFKKNAKEIKNDYLSNTVTGIVGINKDIREYYNEIREEIKLKENKLETQEKELKSIKLEIDNLNQLQTDLDQEQAVLDQKQTDLYQQQTDLYQQQTVLDQKQTDFKVKIATLLKEQQHDNLNQLQTNFKKQKDVLDQEQAVLDQQQNYFVMQQNKLNQQKTDLSQQQNYFVMQQNKLNQQKIDLETQNNNLNSEINTLKSLGTPHISTESLTKATENVVNHGPECYHYYPEDVNDEDKFLTIIPDDKENAIASNENIEFDDSHDCFVLKGMNGIIDFANVCRDNGMLFEINPFYPVVNDQNGKLVINNEAKISKEAFDKITDNKEKTAVTEWARARTKMLQPDFTLLPEGTSVNEEEIKKELTKTFYEEYISKSTTLLNSITDQRAITEFSNVIKEDKKSIKAISRDKKISLDEERLSKLKNELNIIKEVNLVSEEISEEMFRETSKKILDEISDKIRNNFSCFAVVSTPLNGNAENKSITPPVTQGVRQNNLSHRKRNPT